MAKITDKMRLDWLFENGRGLSYDDEYGTWKLDNGEGSDTWGWADSPREAIDLALRNGKSPSRPPRRKP